MNNGKKKIRHSLYCEYSHNCDKDINCRVDNFCDAFRSTTLFTTLNESIFDPDFEGQMDAIWEGRYAI